MEVQAAGPKNLAAPVNGNAQLTRRIADTLKARIGQERFRAWFDIGTTQLRVVGDTLRVDSQNQFVANWIDRNFAEDLRMVALDALGDGATVDVSVAPARSTPRPGEERSPAKPSHRRKDRSRSDSLTRKAGRSDDSAAPAFEPNLFSQGKSRLVLRKLSDFVVGECNRLAFTAAQRLAEYESGGDTPALLIYGDCGVGKTHLLQGICERFGQRCKRADAVRYITAEQFTNDYITAIRANTLDAFRREYRRLALLAIDDVHFLASKEGTQKEFLHTLDAIDLSGARIVLASDEHPRKINQLNPSLVSRLVSRLVVRIDPPDRAMRLAIVKSLAQQRGLKLLDSAAESIASRCAGSVRDVLGVVAQLEMMQEMTAANGASEVGALQIDRLFTDHEPLQRSGPVRMATIIDAVCEHRRIERCDLFGRSRHPRVVLGRGLITHLARLLTSHSYPEIAHALGRSCHSTVHAAGRRIEATLEEAKNAGAAPNPSPGNDDKPTPVEVRSMIEELEARIQRTSFSRDIE